MAWRRQWLPVAGRGQVAHQGAVECHASLTSRPHPSRPGHLRRRRSAPSFPAAAAWRWTRDRRCASRRPAPPHRCRPRGCRAAASPTTPAAGASGAPRRRDPQMCRCGLRARDGGCASPHHLGRRQLFRLMTTPTTLAWGPSWRTAGAVKGRRNPVLHRRQVAAWLAHILVAYVPPRNHAVLSTPCMPRAMNTDVCPRLANRAGVARAHPRLWVGGGLRVLRPIAAGSAEHRGHRPGRASGTRSLLDADRVSRSDTRSRMANRQRHPLSCQKVH